MPNSVMDTFFHRGQSIRESRGSFKLCRRNRFTSVVWDSDSLLAIRHRCLQLTCPMMPINFSTGKFRFSVLFPTFPSIFFEENRNIISLCLNIYRPEYWVISKDVAHGPILGDEIEFHLSHTGEVTMMRNRGSATLLMHVDVSLPLWAIFDVYGSTRAVRLLGTISSPPPVAEPPAVIYQAPPRVSPPRPQQAQPIYQSVPSAHMMQQSFPSGVLSSGTASSYVETLTQSLNCQSAGGGASSECTVCYERSVDCVLYSCGHMCLCYDCALTLYHGGRTAGGQGLCPICRAPIRDVIRAYRS